MMMTHHSISYRASQVNFRLDVFLTKYKKNIIFWKEKIFFTFSIHVVVQEYAAQVKIVYADYNEH